MLTQVVGKSRGFQIITLASALVVAALLLAMPEDAAAGKGKLKTIKVATQVKSASATATQQAGEVERITYASKIAGKAKKGSRKQRKAAQKTCRGGRYVQIYIVNDGVEYFFDSDDTDGKGNQETTDFHVGLPVAGDTIIWRYAKRKTSIKSGKRRQPVVCKAAEATAGFAG